MSYAARRDVMPEAIDDNRRRSGKAFYDDHSRTFPYIRAWSQKYEQGLVVIGVHTPEFVFEKNLGIDYPIGVRTVRASHSEVALGGWRRWSRQGDRAG